MDRAKSLLQLTREQLVQTGALAVLLLMGGLALFGPSGLLAWSEYSSQLDDHQVKVASLENDRNELRNLVERLDPNGADPDLVGELLRRNLNVAHPDEIVITID